MVRKLVAVLIVVSLALFGGVPRMQMPASVTLSTDAAMHMSGDTAMDMAMDGMAAGHPCCPDSDKSSSQPCCDMQRGPGCSFQCGAPSPVFVQAPPSALWPDNGKEPKAPFEFIGLASANGSKLFRPPRSSIPA